MPDAPVSELESLRPYATGPQLVVLDAAKRLGIGALSEPRARARLAEVLEGVTVRGVHNRLYRLRRSAAKHGWAPPSQERLQDHVPPGHRLRGVSTYLDADGNVKGQWVKTGSDPDDEFRESLLRAVRLAVGKRRASPAPRLGKVDPDARDLLTVYPIGDQHWGLYTWRPQVGNSYDLRIARDLWRRTTDRLIRATPTGSDALIPNLGDWVHTDTKKNMTMRSGHHLDADGRWDKILEYAVRAMIELIDKCLCKHRTVSVINAIGNHDDHTAVMVSLALELYYRDESRVHVVRSPALHVYFRFGSNLLGVHHGHTTKLNELPLLMAVERPVDFGQCQHWRWLTGHRHHEFKRDHKGVIVV